MNSSAYNPSEEDIASVTFSSKYLTLAVISLLLVSVFGTFGSLCVLLVFIRKRSLRTVSNYFTIALMIACLIGDVQCFPLQMLLDLQIVTSQPGCYILGAPIVSWSVQVTLCLLAITVERYITICKPLRVDSIITPRRAISALAFVAIYGYLVGYGLTGFTWFGKSHIWRQTRRCDLAFFAPSGFYGPFLFSHWLINIPIMAAIYIYIFMTVRKHIRQIAVFRPENLSEQGTLSGNANEGPVTISRRESSSAVQRNAVGRTVYKNKILEVKSALRLFVVFAMYAINWVPINFFIANRVLSSESTDTNLYILNHLLTYTVGIASPYIYGFGNKVIRGEIIAMLSSIRRGFTPGGGEEHRHTGQASSMAIPQVTLETCE